MTVRVVLYARVSTEEQSEEGHSIDAQIRLCRELCARKGWTIVGEYVDAGISGTTVNRPEFQKMLRAARGSGGARSFDIIVVHKLDRFSRSLVDTLVTLTELSRDGVSFCSASEDFDFTTPIGKVLLALLAAFAQYFIDNLKAETKKGKKERAFKGLYNGVVPFGYQRVPKDAGGIPVPHPQNASAYREIIRRCARGDSASDIAVWLNTNGYRTTGNRGANLFTGDAVLDIAKNRFHLGEVAYKHVWRAGKHAPLVETEIWENAQRMIRQRATNRETTKRADRVYPLRKLIYCAECGAGLRGQYTHKHRLYRDMAAVRRHCRQPQTVRADKIENELGNYFAASALPRDWRNQILARFASNADAERVKAQRRALTNELARARKLFVAGDLSDDEYSVEKRRIELQLDALQPVEHPDMDKAAALLENVGALWNQATDDEKLNLARSLLTKVWIRDSAIVALEPRAAFYPLFELLQKETPPDESDGAIGDTMSPTGATGVTLSSAYASASTSQSATTDLTSKFPVIVILPPGVVPKQK